MNAENQTTEESVVSKKSKGQLFKEKHGYSKTFARNMRKKELDPNNPEDVKHYNFERRTKKKAVREIQKTKHSKAKAGRK